MAALVHEHVVRLHPGQAAIYNSNARFKVVAAGRRFGKSHFAAEMLILEAMRDYGPYGHRLTVEHGVYYIAPTFDQAKRIMWPKIRELAGFERQGGLIRNENVNDGWIELVNGRRIYIKGADNPDSLRGIGLSFVVLDEYADMKAFIWDEIIDPALMDVKGSALFIGTPKGKNHFYKLFMAALEQEKGFEDWEAFHFKSLDNPFLDPAEIERQMRQSNKPLETLRAELEASFVSGGGKTLKPENFPIVSGLPPHEQGHIFVTVDLAGFERAQGHKVAKLDETVIATTWVSPDGWYIWDIQHGQWDSREVALRIVWTLRRHPGCRLGIEKGALFNALGPYLEDEMRRLGVFVTPEPLSHGNAHKYDRIQHSLQGRSERGRIKLVKGDWNDAFLSQVADFPDPLAHDDLIDAVAYVDQMATVSYVDPNDIVEWEALDIDSGY
jgi:hypothetical protein